MTPLDSKAGRVSGCINSSRPTPRSLRVLVDGEVRGRKAAYETERARMAASVTTPAR